MVFQFFFKHNKAPATKHVIHPFVVADDMRPLVDRDRQYLSRLWAVAADRVNTTYFTLNPEAWPWWTALDGSSE